MIPTCTRAAGMTALYEPGMWTLAIPAPGAPLTPNGRLNAFARSRLTKMWRDTTYQLAVAARLPKGLLRVRIDAVLRFATVRNRDIANYTDAVKPIVDALGPPLVRIGRKPVAAAGYSLIPDDTPEHLDGPHVWFGPVRRAGLLVELLITDLSGLAPGRTWTPPRPTENGTAERRTVKRCCNGCGMRVGDVTTEEIEAGMAGRPLPDVRGECPACREAVTDGVA